MMYLSPSGYALQEIDPSQWVEVNIATGRLEDNALRPSSEVLLHLYVYRSNPDVGAIIHTHPPYCIALSLIGEELPIMYPDQAALVGRTSILPYVIPTTELLAEACAASLATACSVILSHHGLVTTGRNLREAYYRTEVVEESSKIYLAARAAGNPTGLTEEEVTDIASLESEAYRIQLLQKMM